MNEINLTFLSDKITEQDEKIDSIKAGMLMLHSQLESMIEYADEMKNRIMKLEARMNVKYKENEI